MKKRIFKFKGFGEAEGSSLNIQADNLILARIKIKDLHLDAQQYEFLGYIEIKEKGEEK